MTCISFTFKINKSHKKDADFPQLLIEDINAKDDDKVLHSVRVQFDMLAEKSKAKIEKWWAFFNAPKKQVKVALFYKQVGA